jgi:hypothetical protein
MLEFLFTDTKADTKTETVANTPAQKLDEVQDVVANEPQDTVIPYVFLFFFY